MKRLSVIVALKVQDSDKDITYFLKVTKSFVIKVWKEQEDANGDPTSATQNAGTES